MLEVSSANWFLSYVLGFQEGRKLKFETWTRFAVCGKFHEFGFVFCWLVNFHIGLFIKRVAIVTFFFFFFYWNTISKKSLIIKSLELSISNFLDFLVLFLSLRSSKDNFREFLGFIVLLQCFVGLLFDKRKIGNKLFQFSWSSCPCIIFLFCFVGLEKLQKYYFNFFESSRFLLILFITPCHGENIHVNKAIQSIGK